MRDKELQRLIQDGQADCEILANEGIIYLVRAVSAEKTALLKDDKGANRVFKSATAAGTHLAALGADKAVVVHQCAYDEVIGHEPIQGQPDLRTAMDLGGLKPLV
ncbi:MAG: DUF6482 family protein [Litorivicinus sp.]